VRAIAELRVARWALLWIAGCGAPVVPQGGPPEVGPRPEAGALDAPAAPADAAPVPDSGIELGPDAPPADAPSIADAGTASTSSALGAARDRLLDLDAARLGVTRCARWEAMNTSERGVFLTITDLLGPRSPFGTGAAIDQVTGVWAIAGAEQGGCVRCCGGRSFNRIYLSITEPLLAAWRAGGAGLSIWEPSRDPGGPHPPFTQSAQTTGDLPRGQAHFFAGAADAVPLGRPGVEAVLDPSAVEIDLDYNVLHDSNPECSYLGGTGRELYQARFGDAELDYRPAGCP
jgi:hypothetical protein